jgi:hypothetical protein
VIAFARLRARAVEPQREVKRRRAANVAVEAVKKSAERAKVTERREKRSRVLAEATLERDPAKIKLKRGSSDGKGFTRAGLVEQAQFHTPLRAQLGLDPLRLYQGLQPNAATVCARVKTSLLEIKSKMED